MVNERALPGRPEHGRSFSILACHEGGARDSDMPSLFRFLTVVALVGALLYGGMFMLANWFDPKPRDISVLVSPDKFARQK
jgi:hypothetical protein